MPRQDPILSNFTGGEFSPSLYGRVDLAKYYNGCRLLENYLIKPQGGAVRRPGTYYVEDVKYHNRKVRLIPFEFSDTQAYILEFGHEYIRFYMDEGQLQSGSAAYEIASPYQESDLFELDYAQSADVMYIVHPDYAPRKLTRTGHTAWTLSTPAFTANPFTGADKYPSCVEFFEQRLFFANSNDDPQKIWGSKSGEYENMTTGAGDDDAVEYTIAASKVNAIRWLAAKDVLLFGTIGAEWRLGATSASEPITPTNVLCRRQSTYGSALVKPVTVGQAILFLQRARRKVRELVYSFEQDTYLAPDMNLLADHMTKSGIVDMAYQQEPDSILWSVLSNGYLVGMTYQRDQEVVGWHRHITDGKVESVACIPSSAIINAIKESEVDKMEYATDILAQEAYPVYPLLKEIDYMEYATNVLAQAAYVSSDLNYVIDWTERKPAGDANKMWYGVASNSDGSHLIAGIDAGRLYTSADYGVTWTERRPAGDADREWFGVASDSDGSHLIAAGIVIDAGAGRLYVSSDYGVTWAETQPAGDVSKNWYGVASDSDGSHLIASVFGGRLYTSSNGGVDWTERRPDGVDANKDWFGIASDSDGSHLIAGALSGRLYTSADYGVTWTERRPAGDANKMWYGAASNSDGSHLIAAAKGGRLYTSADYGVTWTERQPAGDANKDWFGIASDSDGSHLIAGVQNGRLYTSSDYGVTWTERKPAGDANKNWFGVASDSDSSHLIACINNGRLYTGVSSRILQSYSESTIKQQGSYSLKGVAKQTDSLNDTLTRTVSPTINLSGEDSIKLDARASRTGSNFKIEFHDSGGNTISHTINIVSANTWQAEEIDISAVANADKDAIDQIKITILNADADNTFYLDNIFSGIGLQCYSAYPAHEYERGNGSDGEITLASEKNINTDIISCNLQCYSEDTIKTQGTYALKILADLTGSLNETLTRTVAPVIDLTGKTAIKLDVRASRTGSNFKIEFHDSGGNTISHAINIAVADTFQTDTIDISGVADADKDAIDQIKITVINADVANIFYIDNVYADAGALTLDLMEYADDAAAQAAYVSSNRTHADGINYDVSALGTNTITASEAPAGIIAGDMVLLMNMRGSSSKYANVGQYETCKVLSIASSVITLTKDILKIYGESANSDLTDQKIIVQRIPQYSAVTINNSGKLTGSAWNGTKGGIVVFFCLNTVEVKTGGSIDVSDLGYRGGTGCGPGTCTAYQGEGNKGAGIQSTSANGNGGGGAYVVNDDHGDEGGGGSGGHANAGGKGKGTNNHIGGTGGEAVGNADLTKLFLGGGSGGCARPSSIGHSGVTGGGIIYFKTNEIKGAGNIFSKGKTSGNAEVGGGAGGSILIDQSLYVFTGSISVIGGLGTSGNYSMPNGSDGRSKTDSDDKEIMDVQGDYSLKVIADQDDSEDGYLLHTFASVLNLTRDNKIEFYTKSNRIGENFKLQIKSETTEVITEKAVDILVVDEWQKVEWDISGVPDVDKKDIKWLYVAITNDDAENTFYLDNIISIGEYSSTGEDQIWLAVKRTINGVVKRFVEYLKPQAFDSLQDAFFVDSGLSYDGSPATIISGFDHLIGKEVVLLADGLKIAPQTVNASGEITLATAAKKVHGGLAFLPKIQTMNLEAGSATGTAQGKIKRIHEVLARFKDTVGGKIGYDADNLEDIAGTTLFNGDKPVSFPYGYEKDYFVMITQPDPLPMTVICLMPKIVTEDG